jgi:hypothetical protein
VAAPEAETPLLAPALETPDVDAPLVAPAEAPETEPALEPLAAPELAMLPLRFPLDIPEPTIEPDIAVPVDQDPEEVEPGVLLLPQPAQMLVTTGSVKNVVRQVM